MDVIINSINDAGSWLDFIEKVDSNEYHIKTCSKFPSLVMIYPRNEKSLSTCQQMESQSVIFDMIDCKIIAKSFGKMYHNDYVKITDIEITNKPRSIYAYIEGVTIIMYYYKEKWIISTSDNIDAANSFGIDGKSHLDMFMECINVAIDANYNWKQFYDAHDTNLVYVYTMIHKNNMQLLHYKTNKRLLFLFARNKITQNITNANSPACVNVLQKTTYDDYSVLDKMNTTNIDDSMFTCSCIRYAGLMIQTQDEFIILHENNYRIYLDSLSHHINPMTTSFYLSLYQNNSMDTYFRYFGGEMWFKSQDGERYQVKGLIDSLFKIITSELYTMYIEMWELKDCSQKNNIVYNELTPEYKKIFYQIRGEFYSHSGINMTSATNLRIIYTILKKYNTGDLLTFLKERKNIIKHIKIKPMIAASHNSVFIQRILRVTKPTEEFFKKTNYC
uniref:Uncharacterized protein n=1 Tax=Megaviridae environmental sample TaxID=1737588 RepID=A0A5J6VHB0_9VIRU|nr:MAG: hypothetical protein [Megaviridae environmental sample]